VGSDGPTANDLVQLTTKDFSFYECGRHFGRGLAFEEAAKQLELARRDVHLQIDTIHRVLLQVNMPQVAHECVMALPQVLLKLESIEMQLKGKGRTHRILASRLLAKLAPGQPQVSWLWSWATTILLALVVLGLIVLYVRM